MAILKLTRQDGTGRRARTRADPFPANSACDPRLLSLDANLSQQTSFVSRILLMQ